MKHLQKNNPTIGAQSFNLADKAGEDTYIYGEKDSIIYIKEIQIFGNNSENSYGFWDGANFMKWYLNIDDNTSLQYMSFHNGVSECSDPKPINLDEDGCLLTIQSPENDNWIQITVTSTGQCSASIVSSPSYISLKGTVSGDIISLDQISINPTASLNIQNQKLTIYIED